MQTAKLWLISCYILRGTAVNFWVRRRQIMFYYFVKFKLANEAKSKEIALDLHREKFTDACNCFNMTGEHARVYKKILNQVVTPSYLEIVFECEDKIQNPTMCFRSYSKHLVKTYHLESWCTASGNFLKGVKAQEISKNEAFQEHNTSENEEITDLEMVQEILDLCFKNVVENAEQKRERQKIISRIKTILKEYQR